MGKLSIFAIPASLRRGNKHLHRGSSIIRGEQVAAFTGARLNPRNDYENDVCIFIKPSHQSQFDAIKILKRVYIDIIDGDGLIKFANENPQVALIVCSQIDYDNLTRRLPNKVVLIPQHHCNFERRKRNRSKIATVGVIGVPGLFTKLPDNFEEELTRNGLQLLKYSGFRNRQDVVNFYLSIDLQVVWRPWPKKLSNPLKIINAASFGIPTIAYDEDAFREVDGCFIPVSTIDELINQTVALKSSPQKYTEHAEKCFQKAENYHCSQIAEMYRQLP